MARVLDLGDGALSKRLARHEQSKEVLIAEIEALEKECTRLRHYSAYFQQVAEDSSAAKNTTTVQPAAHGYRLMPDVAVREIVGQLLNGTSNSLPIRGEHVRAATELASHYVQNNNNTPFLDDLRFSLRRCQRDMFARTYIFQFQASLPRFAENKTFQFSVTQDALEDMR